LPQGVVASRDVAQVFVRGGELRPSDRARRSAETQRPVEAFLGAVVRASPDHRAVAFAFYLFIPLQYWLIWDSWQTLFAILIPVWAFLLLPVLAVLKGETEDFLPRTARIQWALMLTVYCVSHAPALLILNIPHFAGQNVLLLFFHLVGVHGLFYASVFA
jgi:predicted CDP-diglyceride synthetase/phosphatidate cytidylyltransferase